MASFLRLSPEDNNHTFEEYFELSRNTPKHEHESFCIKFAYYLSILLTDQNKVTKKITNELIQVKQEKAHNEQLLDAFQNTLADFGYKLVDANE